MFKTLFILLILPAPAGADTYRLDNGQWFNGTTFERKTFYSVDGVLMRSTPGEIDDVIDLQDQYVIPPLAEAHRHDLNVEGSLDDRMEEYLAKGIFYVMVQDALYEITPSILERTGQKTTPDVVYARGVLIAPWYDSVIDLYRMILETSAFAPRSSIADLDGHVLFLIESENDIDNKWDEIVGKNSDIIKVLLAFSDVFEERLSNPVPGIPGPGIDPKLIPLIVERAHASDRRVSAHVETAADFHVAVEAGADIIAHLPGWRIGEGAGFSESESPERWKISEADARKAAAHNISVVTTALPKTFLPNAQENKSRFDEIHSHNLRLLYEQGVEIAVGSDSGQLVPGELLNLATYGVFDNVTLLRMATETTARLIFANRRIGRLEQEYEANFLVLRENPIADLRNLDTVTMRFKQGEIISP